MGLCLRVKPLSAHRLHRENGQSYACKILSSWPAPIYKLCTSQVISISDLNNREALHAATRMRCSTSKASIEPEELKSVVSLVGGRLSYLNKVRFIGWSFLRGAKARQCISYKGVKITKYDFDGESVTSSGESLVTQPDRCIYASFTYMPCLFDNLLFQVLSLTVMMTWWMKCVLWFLQIEDTKTEPCYLIAKMEFLLLVTLTGVCEDTEGTTSRFRGRENRGRITSSFDTLCESIP